MTVPIRFDEVLFNPALFLVGGDAGGQASVLEFANYAPPMVTGITPTHVGRFDAITRFSAPLVMIDRAALQYFLGFWRGGCGNAIGFRMRLLDSYVVTDEVFGQGDGVATAFPLKTTYTRPGAIERQDVRRIIKPVVNGPLDMAHSTALYEPDGITSRVITHPFTIKRNGVTASLSGVYNVGNSNGMIYFTTAPANGVVLSWSGEYDTPMTFDTDGFDLKCAGDGAVLQSMGFREILPRELNLS